MSDSSIHSHDHSHTVTYADPYTPPHSPRQPQCPPAPRKRRRSFGGILRRQDGPEPRYLVVKARRSGIWSFPKGHAKKEELALEAAKREIWEETGIALEQISHPPPRFTRLRGGIYYLIDLTHHLHSLPEEPHYLPQDTEEIEEIRWVTRDEMTYLIGNSGMKDFLEHQ